MQQQSKTEHLITKINYRKHKQKLNEIKNNVNSTSLQFYGSGIGKPIDRKKILMLKMKREEIQQENQYLRRKIEKINANATQDGWRRKIVSETEQRRGTSSAAHPLVQHKKYRYVHDQTDRIEVTSDCGDGENIKYFVPSTRSKVRYSSTSHSKASSYNAIMFNLRQKQKKESPSVQPLNQQQKPKQNPQGQSLRPKLPQPHHLQSNPKLKQLIRESTSLTRDDLLYNQPQKQPHRIVLFKKTKIPEPMVSFLIEICLIQKQLLIIAYGMGIVNEDYRLVVSRKRSKEFMEEFGNDYQGLWDRVVVDWDGIRISGFVDDDDVPNRNIQSQLPQAQKQKLRQQKRYEITQDFLQRNYYTLLKQSGKQRQEDPLANPNPKQNNKLSSNKPQSLNNSGNKPKSLFRNKIQYHRERAQSNGYDGTGKKEERTNGKNNESSKEVRKTEKSEANKSSINIANKSEKKIPNKSQLEQDYQQQFEDSQKYQQQNYQQEIDQTPLKNESNQKSISNMTKSKKLSQKNYSQNFQQTQKQPQPQQYSMQYESNPSKIINNKSSINAVKKKTINNNASHVSGVESMIQEDVDDGDGEGDGRINRRNQGKGDKKGKQEDVDQEYIEEFQG